ncbi:PAS domain S-box protein [uncultured Brevundimonas sp.]|uniref:PAS domain S-box protein n=1 Tax=uncultured Brevundimonas sp. TaxID=213418 RepID=UPI0030ECCD7E|tara:strand:+ start:133074 stop:136181 length:3108 start_codon:yes stop_codon:yes gene_type:complete
MPAALAVVVFGLVVAVTLLTRQTGSYVVVWPVNALVLAVALSCARAERPLLLGGAFIGNTVAVAAMGNTLPMALLMAFTNLVEVGVMLAILGRSGSLRLMRRSGIPRFGLAALAACVVSVATAEAGLMAAGFRPTLPGASLWFAANLLGLLVFTPLLLAGLNRRFSELFGADRLQTALGLGLLVLVSTAVFLQSSLPLLFIPPAALTLVAIRSGIAGAALGGLLVSIIAVMATVHGVGPLNLVAGDAAGRFIVLQLFLATLTVIALTVGMTFAERRKLIERLTRARVVRRAKTARERQLIDHAQLAERMSQVGYWTLNIDTGAIFWSPEVYRIHGVDPASFRPALDNALAFYVDGDRQRVEDLVKSGVDRDEGWEFDAVLIRRSDGARRDVRSMAAGEKDANGRIVGYFGVFKDLTEERQVVAKAIEQERRFRLLADNASDVIAVYDRKGVFSYVSPSITEILGYTPEELIGKTPYFIVPEDRESVAAEFEAALDSDVPITIEYCALAKDGSRRWLEARPRFQRDDTGKIIQITDSVRDVTERREREAALAEARAEAEAATRAKTEFLANMSHEIRTPLNGVLGFADVLADTPLSKDQTRYVDRIRTAGRGLTVLIDDILDFSRIEAGKMPVERRPFDLRALALDVVDLTRSGVGDRLTFDVNFSGDVTPWIIGDEQRTRQILLNLLGNAAKFTQTGSVRLEVCLADEMVELRVIDTGIGIAPEALAHLFQAFTQADASVGRRFGGTGLGLSISHSLARLMGGEVRLDSVPGAGTTAVLSLPYAVATAPETAPVAAGTPEAVTGRSLKVLVVDDVEANLELIDILLSRAGHRIKGVTSGDAALALLEADTSFDVVLMDVQMPGMDGLEATRLIRRLGNGVETIPIVALTANVMAEQVAECRAAGMDEHLTKPIRTEELFEVIVRVGALSDPPVSPTSAPGTADPLAALKGRYRFRLSTLATEFAEMDSLDEPDRTQAITALAHSIAGTSGSMGFDEVSKAAFTLEAAANESLAAKSGSRDLAADIEALIAAVASS